MQKLQVRYSSHNNRNNLSRLFTKKNVFPIYFYSIPFNKFNEIFHRIARFRDRIEKFLVKNCLKNNQKTPKILIIILCTDRYMIDFLSENKKPGLKRKYLKNRNKKIKQVQHKYTRF